MTLSRLLVLFVCVVALLLVYDLSRVDTSVLFSGRTPGEEFSGSSAHDPLTVPEDAGISLDDRGLACLVGRIEGLERDIVSLKREIDRERQERLLLEGRMTGQIGALMKGRCSGDENSLDLPGFSEQRLDDLAGYVIQKMERERAGRRERIRKARIDSQLARYSRMLGLTDSQQRQFASILSEFEMCKSMAFQVEAESEAGAAPEELHRQVVEMRRERDKRIKDLLSPAQYEKYELFQKEQSDGFHMNFFKSTRERQ